ncbi:MAG: hypothetical protein JKY86_03290 [Gammaproteobacteria bacterium]|nr:hypothetical protein [Gammaproteobacteria bacterium]
MSEIDVIEHIGYRGERLWFFLQWWSSISFAVMAAAFLGSRKLNRVIATIIVSMYTLATATIMQGVSNQSSWVDSGYAQLQRMASSGELSLVGMAALERQENLPLPAEYITQFFAGAGFLFTVGFVVYCHRKLND